MTSETEHTERNRGGQKFWKKFGESFFVALPMFALLVIIISLFVGIILAIAFPFILFFELFFDLSTMPFDKYSYIQTITGIIELGLFISLTYIIALGLFDYVVDPIINKRQKLDFDSLGDKINNNLKPLFLSLVITLIVLYIFDTSTNLVRSYGQNTGIGYFNLGILLALTLAALIISLISYMGKKEAMHSLSPSPSSTPVSEDKGSEEETIK